MVTTQLSFAEAFDMDLRHSPHEQSEICGLLTGSDEPPLTSAAISNWKSRNAVPYSRLVKLAEIFGPDSQCAVMLERIRAKDPSLPRKQTGRPVGPHMVMEQAPMYNPQPMKFVTHVLPAESVRAAGASDADQINKLLSAVAAVLAVIPEEQREPAAQAAFKTVVGFMSPS